MEISMSIADYYPKDGSKFIDPLYRPYINSDNTLTQENQNRYDLVNTKSSVPYGFHSDTIRMGRTQSYQKIHKTEPCAPGFYSGPSDQMCTKITGSVNNSRNFAGTFYTDSGLQNHYTQGYAANQTRVDYLKSLEPHPELETRSVNPFTGEYVVYFSPPPNKITNTYSKVPTKFSYLG